jgi:hypothetical protein
MKKQLCKKIENPPHVEKKLRHFEFQRHKFYRRIFSKDKKNISI